MTVNEWVEEAAAQRSDELREEYGTDNDLQDAIEELINSLEGDVKARVSELINRMEQNRLQDNTNIYRGAFRDGLRYAFEVVGRFPGYETEN